MTTVDLPVKAHVKKFLVKRYGDNPTITRRSFLGSYILDVLEHDFKKTGPLASELFTLQLPEYYFSIKGHSISRGNLKNISDVMDRLFMEDFYMYIDLLVFNGLNAYQAVKKYMDFYTISENDFKLESLYRQYQRYSDEKIKDKKSACLVIK